MQANYVARKTAWSAVTFWRIVLCFLIVPLIVMVVDIFVKRSSTIEFYDGYVIQKSGVLSRKEDRLVFPKVASVSVNQSLFGRIFNYGDVKVDVVGKWDVDLKGVSKPHELKKYLEDKMVEASEIKPTVFA